jgi:hypothetical protein
MRIRGEAESRWVRAGYAFGGLMHACLLVAGTWLMLEWLTSTQDHFEHQSFEVALSELVTALAVLALCLVYIIHFLQRGPSLLAAVLFALTYPLLGLTLSASLRGMAKDFAPAAPADAQIAFLVAYAMIYLSALSRSAA